MAKQKSSRFDLKKYHTIFLELGLIASILIFTIAMKADLPGKKLTVDFSNEKEVPITIRDVPQTEARTQPAVPPAPDIMPTEPSDDPIIDAPQIKLNNEPFFDDATMVIPDIKNDPDEDIYMVVEQEPKIIGGQQALYDKLKYPARCKNAGIEGRVVLQFVVNTDGSVQDVEVIRGIGGGCDKAAVKALKTMRFKPGLQQGKPVRVRFSWPILFRLQ